MATSRLRGHLPSTDTYLHPRFRARVLSRRAEVLWSVKTPLSSWRATLAPGHGWCWSSSGTYTGSNATCPDTWRGLGGGERGLRRGLSKAGVGTNKWGVQRDDASELDEDV